MGILPQFKKWKRDMQNFKTKYYKRKLCNFEIEKDFLKYKERKP